VKRVRITLWADDVVDHPVADMLTGGAEYLSTVELWNWNVSGGPVGYLLRVAGDHERLAAELDGIGAVDDYELVPAGGGWRYCYLRGEAPPAARALFENFTRGGLLTVPPVEYGDDGSSTFTLVGSTEEVQAAVERVPDAARVEVEAVGGRDVAPDGPLAKLTERQREALAAAHDRGYYEVPRRGTTEDVAAALDCSPTTAATHLRKAEAKLVSGLLSE
jgi:hypothetical protein